VTSPADQSSVFPLPDARAELGSRALWPRLQWRIHANFASVSPASEPVLAFAAAQMRDMAERGAAAFVSWIGQRERLRGRLAALCSCDPADVGLLGNTTAGVTAIALSQPWPTGSTVLGFAGEFPANVTPWQQAAALFNLHLELLPLPDPAGPDPAADLLTRVEDRLRGLQHGPNPVFVVAISAVQFQTGWQAPLGQLAALCHRYCARLSVDAVQALGLVPLDLPALGIDFLACGSHKWLMGPEGGGLLYVAPQHLQDWQPRTAGWLSHQDPVEFLFRGAGHLRYDRPIRQRADQVEGGNVAGPSLAGLEMAVALIQQLPAQAIWDHVQAWHDAVEPGLLAMGFESLRARDDGGRSGILALRPPVDVDPVVLQRLVVRRGVLCSLPDGLLRLAPHWCSPLAECAEVVAVIQEAVAEARSGQQTQ